LDLTSKIPINITLPYCGLLKCLFVHVTFVLYYLKIGTELCNFHKYMNNYGMYNNVDEEDRKFILSDVKLWFATYFCKLNVSSAAHKCGHIQK